MAFTAIKFDELMFSYTEIERNIKRRQMWKEDAE